MKKITEASSQYQHLEQMSIKTLLVNINKEDQIVPLAVERAIPQIERLVAAIVKKLTQGGRLFYLGAGTSGRLGILDASECPPTYGVPDNLVIGLIAGGEPALRKAVEAAEDSREQAWTDLKVYDINEHDVVIGITASGTTTYVVEGLAQCRKNDITTSCITCNPGTPVAQQADFPIEVVVGPEFVTGSTRMKAGTAQKMVLNMISTSVMIRLGHVMNNQMVDMLLSNEKLVDRGTKILVQTLQISYADARNILLKAGSVRQALSDYQGNV